MKTKFQLSVLVSIFVIHTSSFGQGALTPTAAPAPVMKSLAQIEPRTPISSTPFTITNSGSYYLTTNFFAASNAIVIASSGVMLDLGGWTINSTAANAVNGGAAILLVGGVKNVTIQNGFIQGGVTNNGSGVFNGGGFLNGIHYSGNAPVNILVSTVSISGCLNDGIFLLNSDSTMVKNCTVRTVGGFGIVASTIKDCVAVDCDGAAISGNQVSDCRGEGVGNSFGIYANNAMNSYAINGLRALTALNCYGYGTVGNGMVVIDTAQNCFGSSLNYSGISVADGGTLVGCTVSSSVTGITAGNHCTIKDCTAYKNFTNGIVAGQGCRISGCTANSNGTGAGGRGITADIRSTIENCTANDNQSDGIFANGDSTVLNNHASHNGLGNATAAGIHVTGAGSRIDGNHTRDNSGYGIKSDGGVGADAIVRNTSGGNGTQYSPSTGNTFAPVQTAATMTNPTANQ